MSEFKIHVLGCGSAKPTPRHNPSSTVVDYHGNLFMIDCGEGAQQAFMRQKLKIGRLSDVFLTHLHGDHVFGLFGLIGTMALQCKGGRLRIHTFEEGKRILDQINGFFNRDTPFEIEYNILDPKKEQIALETAKLRVRTVPLRHRVHCVGYIVEEKEKPRHIVKDMCDFHGVPIAKMRDIIAGEDFTRADGRVIPNAMLTRDPSPSLSYAHLSDTVYMPELAAKVGPVTLMMHETTYLDEHQSDAKARFHSTARQAAMTARDAGARCLLTGHYSSRYKEEADFKKEAGEIFPNVILGKEGLTVDVGELL